MSSEQTSLDNDAFESAIKKHRVGSYLAGCFPVVLPLQTDFKRSLISSSLWVDGWSGFVELTQDSHNVRLLWALTANSDALPWTGVLQRLRSPTACIVSKSTCDQWVLARLCEDLSSNKKIDQVETRRWFHNTICHGIVGSLVSEYLENLRRNRPHWNSQCDGDPAPDLLGSDFKTLDINNHIATVVFPYKAVLEREPSFSEEWDSAARNCINSFIAYDEYIPKQTLLSGLSAAPYYLRVPTARMVVKHSEEFGYLQNVNRVFVSLPSATKLSSRWTRSEVASELQSMITGTKHYDSWTATCLSAIRWNFQGTASLNDEMGLLVPAWCRLTKEMRESRAASYCSLLTRSVVSSLLEMLDLLGGKLQKFDENIRADGENSRERDKSSFRIMNNYMLNWGEITKKTHRERDKAISDARSVNDVSFLESHGSSIRNEFCERFLRPSVAEGEDAEPQISPPNVDYRKAPPAYSSMDGNWILSHQLAHRIEILPRSVSDARKKNCKGLPRGEANGEWGVDNYGTFRRKVGGTNKVAYYIPNLKPLYAHKLHD